MRSTRLRKFRNKYQPLIICFKSVLSLYMIIFSVSYLTTDTVAYFDDINVSTIMITTGVWEEENEVQEKETADEENQADQTDEDNKEQENKVKNDVEETTDSDSEVDEESIEEKDVELDEEKETNEMDQ